MRRALLLSASLLALGACASNTATKTAESWVPVSPEQRSAYRPDTIDVYNQPAPPPQIGKNGCAPMTDSPGGIKVVSRTNPAEVYCIYVAPGQVTMLLLPAGVQLIRGVVGMSDAVVTDSSTAGGRTAVTIVSKCTPPVKGKDGALVVTQMQELLANGSLPYCARWSSDLVLLTTGGPLTFRLMFSGDARTRVVDLNTEPVVQRQTVIPVRPPQAQTLYASSVDKEIVPWVPDDIWSDGAQTVILWLRPMPTLPSMHINPLGSEVATPTVVVHPNQIAMIYPRRVTEFQLRMDNRILQISAIPPKDSGTLVGPSQQVMNQSPPAQAAPAALPTPAPQPPAAPPQQIQAKQVPPTPTPKAAPAATAPVIQPAAAQPAPATARSESPETWPARRDQTTVPAQPATAASTAPIPLITGNGGGKP
jgi:hypothetical protein